MITLIDLIILTIYHIYLGIDIIELLYNLCCFRFVYFFYYAIDCCLRNSRKRQNTAIQRYSILSPIKTPMPSCHNQLIIPSNQQNNRILKSIYHYFRRPIIKSNKRQIEILNLKKPNRRSYRYCRFFELYKRI